MSGKKEKDRIQVKAEDKVKYKALAKKERVYEEDLLQMLIEFWEKNKIRIDNIRSKESALNLKLEKINVILEKTKAIRRWLMALIDEIEVNIKEIEAKNQDKKY